MKIDGVTAIGIEEVARSKGHQYATLVYQIDKGCLIGAVSEVRGRHDLPCHDRTGPKSAYLGWFWTGRMALRQPGTVTRFHARKGIVALLAARQYLAQISTIIALTTSLL